MRTLDWDGSRNTRDLGGLPTRLSRTGRTTLGRVARGPRREMLTSAGWDAAVRWGLHSIVDIRTSEEVGPRGADPGVEPPETIAIMLAPTEDHDNVEFREVCFPTPDPPEYWQHNVRILPALVRNTLETIAASEPGVLVHCAAGRDRTGMISALLLANAGVSVDDVFGDYAESVRAMAGTAAHGGPTHDRQASWSSDQVDTWLAEVQPHVRAFVVDVERVFGRIGVSAETRNALRMLLTSEDAALPMA